MANPPQMVATLMIWFGNFFMKMDKDHTWASVKKMMANPNKFVDQVHGFDYDSVSGPSVKRIKNLELHPVEAYQKKAQALVVFATVLHRAKEYYMAKTNKAQALMKHLSQSQ